MERTASVVALSARGKWISAIHQWFRDQKGPVVRQQAVADCEVLVPWHVHKRANRSRASLANTAVAVLITSGALIVDDDGRVLVNPHRRKSENPRIKNSADVVMGLLRERTTITGKQLALHTGSTYMAASEQLKKMRRSGRLITLRPGLYALPGTHLTE
jgi:hypothetical protein